MVEWKQKNLWYVVAGVAIVIVLLLILFIRGNRGQSRQVMALDALLAAESMTVGSELLINLPPYLDGHDRPFTKISLSVVGDLQRTEDGIPEITGKLSLEAAGRGNTFFANGDTRILRDRVLFYLNELPVFLNPSGSLVEKWTEVETSLLVTNNREAVHEALRGVFNKLELVGEEDDEGETLLHYSAALSAEDEQALADAMRLSVSGNQGAHVTARLLDANDVKAFDVWIDKDSQEIRRAVTNFVARYEDNEGQQQEFDFATLELIFGEYGTDVAIDVPEHELTVDPAVFGEVFGSTQRLDTIDLDN